MTRSTEVEPVWKADPAPKKRPKPLNRVSKRKREEEAALDAITPFLKERSGGHCEIRSEVCTRRCDVRHHLLRRPHTGGVQDPEMVRLVCWQCHDYVHANPEVAYANGWLIRNGVSA